MLVFLYIINCPERSGVCYDSQHCRCPCLSELRQSWSRALLSGEKAALLLYYSCFCTNQHDGDVSKWRTLQGVRVGLSKFIKRRVSAPHPTSSISGAKVVITLTMSHRFHELVVVYTTVSIWCCCVRFSMQVRFLLHWVGWLPWRPWTLVSTGWQASVIHIYSRSIDDLIHLRSSAYRILVYASLANCT